MVSPFGFWHTKRVSHGPSLEPRTLFVQEKSTSDDADDNAVQPAAVIFPPRCKLREGLPHNVCFSARAQSWNRQDAGGGGGGKESWSELVRLARRPFSHHCKQSLFAAGLPG